MGYAVTIQICSFKEAFTLRLMGLFLLLILAAIVPIQVAAKTFYVDQSHPNASDSNPGTEDRPWKTPYAWIKVVQAGDTVLVKNGVYDVTEGGSWARPALNPMNEGKPGMPIIFKAYPGHRVVLEGSQATIGSSGRDYIIVDGFHIITGHVAVFGKDHDRVKGVVIQNNSISNKRCRGASNCEGIRIEKASGTLVRGNRIFDIYNETQSPNAAGIKLYHGDNLVIENNDISDTVVGVFLKDDSSLGTVRYNYVHSPVKIGIAVWSNNGNTHKDNKIYGNIVSGSNYQGFYISGSDNSPNINTYLYNNTVVNSASTAYAIDTDIENVQVWNNIAYNAPKSGINSDNPSFSYCDYNLYYLTTEGCGQHRLTNNPKFVSTAFSKPEDFKLLGSSPARRAGKNGEDIGAYATGREVIGIIR